MCFKWELCNGFISDENVFLRIDGNVIYVCCKLCCMFLFVCMVVFILWNDLLDKFGYFELGLNGCYL